MRVVVTCLAAMSTLAWCSAGGAGTNAAGSAEQADSTDAMRSQLTQLRDGAIPMSELRLTYDDMHPFHGGMTLTVRGSSLEARYLERGVEPQQVEPEPRPLPPEELRSLVDLLLELEAWEQRVAERDPVPDESRASLTIEVAGESSVIWEWYNDLTGNDRIVRVKLELERLAGPPPSSATP